MTGGRGPLINVISLYTVILYKNEIILMSNQKLSLYATFI